MSFLKKVLVNQRFQLDGSLTVETDKFAGMSLQLRIEQSGQGVMVINANNVLHLNHISNSIRLLFHAGLTPKRGLSQDSPHVPRKR